MCSPNTYACKGVSIQIIIPIFPANSAEGLHFSAFHCGYTIYIYSYIVYEREEGKLENINLKICLVNLETKDRTKFQNTKK